ncbi:hypothetical protein [Enterococcus ureasiticus]|uniref:Uncharacterized protein n=1 Tax=Enterococcus ureasiticus TaxID=903984 RepID=A0A1E5GIN7_9ENTE|nr:hypothetical protein [Enterococcus ureasiticus]OEG12110.1 hypothetical protein BCR21_07690 [Enterococcus ureasiticus]
MNNKKMTSVFLGILTLVAMVGVMFTSTYKAEAATPFLNDLSVKESTDSYVVRYNLTKVKKGASIHLSIMSQQGKELADKGIIATPEKAGAYEFEISKKDINLNEGFFIEYRTNNDKVLDGLGKHLVSVNGINYF